MTLPRLDATLTVAGSVGSHRPTACCHTMKVRDVVQMLRADGWYLSRTRGSHHQYRHAEKPGVVTVPGTGNHDLARGTFNSILKQAGLKPAGRK